MILAKTFLKIVANFTQFKKSEQDSQFQRKDNKTKQNLNNFDLLQKPFCGCKTTNHVDFCLNKSILERQASRQGTTIDIVFTYSDKKDKATSNCLRCSFTWCDKNLVKINKKHFLYVSDNVLK